MDNDNLAAKEIERRRLAEFNRQLNESPISAAYMDTPMLNRKQRRTYVAQKQREATKLKLKVKRRKHDRK